MHTIDHDFGPESEDISKPVRRNWLPEKDDALHELDVARSNFEMDPFEAEVAGAAPEFDCRMAAQIAKALGKCTLFGLDAECTLEEVLPVRRACMAARGLHRQIIGITHEISHEEWAERWGMRETILAEPMVEVGALRGVTVMDDRMGIWGACIVLEDLLDELHESGVEVACIDEMERQMNKVARATEMMDAMLNRQMEDLVAYGRLSDTLNLRWNEWLVEPYCTDVPWWMDGRAEAVEAAMISESVRAVDSFRKLIGWTLDTPHE